MLIWQKYLFLIKTNGLALNVKKIEFMVQVGTWQKLKHCDPIELFLDDVTITRVDTYKYLGVTVDCNISWAPRVNKVCKKASSSIGMLKRIMLYLSKPTAKLVYNTTIAPIFDYCGVVWDTCSDTTATKVQQLQNRAARQILGVNNGTPSDSALSQLG